MSKKKQKDHSKLGQFAATAISGNDILSSALYVSGIAILFAGIYAPLVLALIGVVLFFYKAVYIEVVEALPINGGAYNCLLNGTSKTVAALAGVTTILSYIATAVISAKTAVEYLHTVLPIPVIPGTIALMFFFAVLVISGIKDSAKVAIAIFSFHIITLIVFVAFGGINVFNGHSFFWQNFHQTNISLSKSGILYALFFGFSASLLGVSGFESSANFVEEQEKGVFRKTLRNMLAGVAIFNPSIALVVLTAAPMTEIIAAKDFLLSDIAKIFGGTAFQYIVVADAFLVLAGAVLAAYVGVGGLIYRMASDACLPNFLTQQNKNGAYPRIVVTFFLLCTSILLVTHGDLLSLAGVYTIAFLGVMSLFALGNMILRETRTELKRTYYAPMIFISLALFSTVAGIIGNIKIDPNNVVYFATYFVPAVVLVLMIVYEDYNMRLLLRLTQLVPPLHRYLSQHVEDMTGGTFVAFIHHINNLYRILDYINRNETGWNIVLIHCNNDEPNDYKKSYLQLKEVIPCLKEAGVFPHFNIKILYKNQPFGPAMIEQVSNELGVRKNRIMIGSIHETHPFDYSDLGGVRIIF